MLRNERGPHLGGTTCVVLGFARSGRAAASLLVEAGAKVRCVDAASAEKLSVAPEDVPGGTSWLGREDPAVLEGTDFVIASPGIPPRNPVLAAALARGIPVRSELELGWWFTDAPVVAITGTNGKTTTTELVGAMGRAAGRDTLVAGNVGTPLSGCARKRPDLIVLEVSSFQLYLCHDFRPHVAAVLNLTSDHLDWHPDFEDYARAKGKLFAKQGPQDAAVLNGADPEVVERYSNVAAEVFLFRESPPPAKGSFLRDGRVVIQLDGEAEPLLPLSEWPLAGRHNRENLMAAALCARLIGLPGEAIRSAARTFRALPHRMEVVGVVGGVTWINDSKSTNPGSLEKALDPDVSTILIAGGLTKGVDFRPIREEVARGARLVLLIGQGAADIEKAWSPAVRMMHCEDLSTAVQVAASEARSGERVLLSPACASFDQFQNYVHRGNRFRELVHELSAGRSDERGSE
ncbi:MAG: UDP-N-acetylmuramoyl-L-alanine--D-glutamate ligase [bacterium]